MSANTPKAGLTYPSLSDPPNIPSNLQTLAGQLDGMVIPKYASETAMNAANPSPTAGDTCYRTDLTACLTYTGSAWLPMSSSAWQSFTPTWNGISVMGGAVSTGRYRRVGKTVDLIASLAWGTGSDWGNNPVTVSLPVSALSVAGALWSGTGTFVTSGAWGNIVCNIGFGQNSVHLYAVKATDQTLQEVGNTGWSWAAGSSANLQITYEIA